MDLLNVIWKLFVCLTIDFKIKYSKHILTTLYLRLKHFRNVYIYYCSRLFRRTGLYFWYRSSLRKECIENYIIVHNQSNASFAMQKKFRTIRDCVKFKFVNLTNASKEFPNIAKFLIKISANYWQLFSKPLLNTSWVISCWYVHRSPLNAPAECALSKVCKFCINWYYSKFVCMWWGGLILKYIFVANSWTTYYTMFI